MRRCDVHSHDLPRRQSFPRLKFRRLSDGFSLAEVLVIIAIMAVLIVVTAPSIANLVDGTRLAESVVDVRTAFMETQRQAIRSGAPCTVEVARAPGDAAVRSACIAQGERELVDRLRIKTNIGDRVSQSLVASSLIANNCGNGFYEGCNGSIPIGLPNPYPPIRIGFGILGTAKFNIDRAALSTDGTGQIVFTLHESSSLEPRCLAISSTLGLTRTGIYRGGWPRGTCNASETGR